MADSCRRTDGAVIGKQGSRRCGSEEAPTDWQHLDSGHHCTGFDTDRTTGWVCKQGSVHLPCSTVTEHSAFLLWYSAPVKLAFYWLCIVLCCIFLLYRMCQSNYTHGRTHGDTYRASSCTGAVPRASHPSGRLLDLQDSAVQALLEDLAVEVDQGNMGSCALVVDRILGKPNEARKNLYSAIESISPSQRQQAREAISAVQHAVCNGL